MLGQMERETFLSRISCGRKSNVEDEAQALVPSSEYELDALEVSISACAVGLCPPKLIAENYL